MSSLAAAVTGFLLDLLFGDPVWMYHPIRLIGALITKMEGVLRKLSGTGEKNLLFAGGVLWVAVAGISTVVPLVVLYAAGSLSPWLRYVLESVMCYQLLATKSLKTESMKVYDRLRANDVEGARKAVSMIVGRDTKSLDSEGITKAAVETVAENTSDGIVAPLLYILIGGAPLGFFYKAANTMDSMVGYKNENYLYFGRVAAKADDLCNFLPARISALLMIAAAALLGMDVSGAWNIYVRDRFKHASPNAAQTEAVCAGALQIQLAGNAYYFGKLYEKEYIGDPVRPVEREDIRRSNRLLYGTAILTMVVFGLLKWMILSGMIL